MRYGLAHAVQRVEIGMQCLVGALIVDINDGLVLSDGTVEMETIDYVVGDPAKKIFFN